MLGRATGNQAVVDISTELSWSCMTCICTPQAQGYKKLLDQASPLPVAARGVHHTTLLSLRLCRPCPAEGDLESLVAARAVEDMTRRVCMTEP